MEYTACIGGRKKKHLASEAAPSKCGAAFISQVMDNKLSVLAVGAALAAVAGEIRERLNCAVLIVEQKVEQVLSVADHVLALRMGLLEFCGAADIVRERMKELFL